MKSSHEEARKKAVKYWENQKKTMFKGDANRAFFKNIKSYNSKEKPPNFDMGSLFESGCSDAQVAEGLADHFNGISCKFDGLNPDQIPHTFSCPIPALTREQVAKKLQTIRKPKSIVHGKA